MLDVSFLTAALTSAHSGHSKVSITACELQPLTVLQGVQSIVSWM
jgi:hypothetical protein